MNDDPNKLIQDAKELKAKIKGLQRDLRGAESKAKVETLDKIKLAKRDLARTVEELKKHGLEA
jgi:hypothetical protein